MLAKLTSAVSPHLQQGGFVVYKFFSTAVTYPLLFAIGVSMTPWDKLMAAFNLPDIITIFCTVATLMAIGRRLGMARWRETLFAFMHHNAQRSGAYFNIPSAQIMEIGIEFEI